MIEIEVKILEVDVNEITQKLKKLGAKKVFDGEMDTCIFDYPDRSIWKNNGLFRLRKKGDCTELTFKKKAKTKIVKSAEELEVNVSDFETTRKIIKLLGLKEHTRVAKHRTSYSLKDAHFELDTYPGIPTFLEIETTSAKKIKEYVNMIGFTMKDTKAWSGRDVFKHYGKKIWI